MPRKKKTYRRRATGIRKVNQKINRLYRITAPEKKFHDIASTAQAISSTASFYLLNGITQGDTASAREGQRITMLYSWLSFDILCSSATTGTVVRIMIIYDKQPNAAIFAASDLLVGATNLNSPYVIGYSMRFRVIMDKRFNLSTTGSNYQVMKTNYRRLNLRTQYNTTNGGTIADIASGSVYLVAISDEPTNTPSLSFYHRLRFAG